MSARWVIVGVSLLGALGLVFSCRFEPDLSRFEACAEDGSCAPGFTCLAEAQRCLPDCSSQDHCATELPPDASTDAGVEADGGTDGGAGTDAGMDAGPPLSLVTQTLAPAVEAAPYSLELQARGGTPPYAFRATEALPQGLELDGGVLSGTLPTPGTYRVAVEVSDSEAPPARTSTAYDLRVRQELRAAGPRILVDGYSGSFYTERVSAIGGVPPYSFAVVSGSLPSGAGLLQDGSVTGTPSGDTEYNFRVQVTDSDPQQPQTAERDLSLTISGAPLLLALSTESVPDGRVGTAYQYTLRTAPGSADTWTLKAGVLPRGVGFDPDTAVISGTPNEAGSFTFTIHASSGLLGSAERSFTMKVY